MLFLADPGSGSLFMALRLLAETLMPFARAPTPECLGIVLGDLVNFLSMGQKGRQAGLKRQFGAATPRPRENPRCSAMLDDMAALAGKGRTSTNKAKE
jgi:hypothetical protein